MKFETVPVGEQLVRIDATIEKADYIKKYKDKLKDIKNKGSFKGFRKGKTPNSFIEKMYGLQTISDVVNNVLLTGLYEHIKSEEIEHILDPILSESAEAIDFDLKSLTDYNTSFDLALKPSIDIKGLDEVYEVKKIAVDDATITEEIEGIRKQMGKQVPVEDTIKETDIITLALYQVDESGNPLDEGVEKESKVYVQDLNQEYIDQLVGKSLSFTFGLDPYNLEKNRETSFVNKYLLGIEGEEKLEQGFEAVVNEILRQELADLNQEFFDRYTGEEGKITSEDELRALIKENIAKFYTQQSDNILHREIIDRMKASTSIELPMEHVMKWYEATNRGAEQPQPEESSIANELKWALIMSQLVKENNIEVSKEDLKEAAMAQASQYMRGYGNDPQMLNYMADYMLNDKKQVANLSSQVESKKVFEILGEQVSKTENEITIDEYRELVKTMQQ